MEFISLNPPARHIEPVELHAAAATADAKINFAVPAGKRFFITFWSTCISEGDKMIISLQSEAVSLDCIGNGEGKTGGESHLFPDQNPIGAASPIEDGDLVRLFRTLGTAGKDWGGTIIGYLEDAT